MSEGSGLAAQDLRGAVSEYTALLDRALSGVSAGAMDAFATDVETAWHAGRQLLICGNGGSAANAIHLANDFFYGISSVSRAGMKVHALPANAAITSCLSNDVSYERVFAEQLVVLAEPGDVLLVLSGSGNSRNVLEALAQAKDQGIRSHAILGFDGGEALALADNAMHVEVDDMQIAEDAQMAIGHALMQMMQARALSASALQADG